MPRFTLEEARELFRPAGVELPESALALLCERAEGWAAGLWLAGLSLSGYPDPARFAAEFSGSERTVADYLLAEGSGGERDAAQPGVGGDLRALAMILRYLPTNLTAPEIAGELYVSVNTVRTHMRRIYAELGVHRRNKAVERASTLGLLAPSSRRP